ncbi:MAG: hypothetical protein IPJ13_08005 [Saprospiraceae bacterium]|nr:hypothetical protein [Saprospiraceae bacterium]
MEFWERDFEFLRVRTIVKNALKKDTLPDLQTILFLIGVQELGRIPKSKFTKKKKRPHAHCSCNLLESEGYFEFEGRDQDGWPHWKEKTPFSLKVSTNRKLTWSARSSSILKIIIICTLLQNTK